MWWDSDVSNITTDLIIYQLRTVKADNFNVVISH